MASARALGRMAFGVRNMIFRPSSANRMTYSAKQLCFPKQFEKNASLTRSISSRPLLQASNTEDKEEEIVEPPNWVSNLFGFTKPESETQIVSEEEKIEREKMFEEVSDMYFAKPKQLPTIEFFEKAVDMLIKYNDGHGVEVIWKILEESDVVPPEELICKMEEFLGKAKEESWFK